MINDKEKRNDKDHYEKASSFHLAKFQNGFFVLFLRKRLLRLLCSLLCYLFMQENVQTDIKGKTLRSSRSQMFFKIGVLKNLAIFTRKYLSWSLFLIKLQAKRPAFLLKKRHQHRYFSVNIAKLLRTVFLQNTFCSLYFSEIFM